MPGKEQLPSSVSWGQAREFPFLPIPCSLAIPHYILHQKQTNNKQIEILLAKPRQNPGSSHVRNLGSRPTFAWTQMVSCLAVPSRPWTEAAG